MTKQIDIQELIPYLRDGWVAMEEDERWFWYDEMPFIEDEMWVFEGSSCASLGAFNITPTEDWSKSLIKVGEKRNKIKVKTGKRYLTRERRLAFVHTDGSYNGKKIYWYVITGNSTQYFCDEQGKNLGDCCDCWEIDLCDLVENKDD